MATDFLGRTLNIGDDVFFLNYNGTSANLERGKITKVFPHTAEIGMKRRAEYKIVKILTDVAPVVHARWVQDADGDWYCTNCDEVVAICESGRERTYRKPYCPNCGAKMDGGDRDESD